MGKKNCIKERGYHIVDCDGEPDYDWGARRFKCADCGKKVFIPPMQLMLEHMHRNNFLPRSLANIRQAEANRMQELADRLKDKDPEYLLDLLRRTLDDDLYS